MDAAPTPLPTLLSFAYVAYAIEFDNEFERQLIEPTGLTFETWKASRAEVFLVSLPMWANYVRFLPPEGMPLDHLARLVGDDENMIVSRTKTLARWRYVRLVPTKPSVKPPLTGLQIDRWIAQPTAAGIDCQALWSPLPVVIEERWRERFGQQTYEDLRDTLAGIVAGRNAKMPRCLPIISSRRGMFSQFNIDSSDTAADEELPTFTLLAHALLMFTLAFERSSTLALPLCANVLRVLRPEAIPVRELPVRAGVSKEGIAQGLTLLKRHGLAVVEGMVERPGQAARLTEAGLDAQANYLDQIVALEAHWHTRFGELALKALRRSLQAIVGDGNPVVEPLAQGLAPHACNWRAAVPPPEVLPHYPLMLDRGGWPDAA